MICFKGVFKSGNPRFAFMLRRNAKPTTALPNAEKESGSDTV